MNRFRELICGIFIFLGVANFFAWKEISKSLFAQVAFLDVGQGDAIFIQTSQGHQILIDGGPDNMVAEELGKVMPFWDKSLDLVILTHPDNDHIGGLPGVLDRYRVENVLWTGVKKETNGFTAWEEAIKKEEAHQTLANAPQVVRWSSWADEFLEILYPSEAQKEGKASNDTSIVSKFVYRRTKVLLTGDISSKVEQELLNNGIDLQADILKVPHHGSKSSSLEKFIQAVNPSVAIIQVGEDNRYGHPHQEILERFSLLGIPVLRTDMKNGILIQSDGKSWRILGNTQ